MYSKKSIYIIFIIFPPSTCTEMFGKNSALFEWYAKKEFVRIQDLLKQTKHFRKKLFLKAVIMVTMVTTKMTIFHAYISSP